MTISPFFKEEEEFEEEEFEEEEKWPIKYERHVPLLMVAGDVINHQRHKNQIDGRQNPKIIFLAGAADIIKSVKMAE